MTRPAPAAPSGLAALCAAAAAAGLTVLSSACWPEEGDGGEVTPLPGFIESTFSPLIAEVGGRVLSRRDPMRADGTVIAIVLVTALGDVTSAVRVATAVDTGERVPPLLFYQSVPNAVAGYLAARWNLTGPVVCVSGIRAALEAAALLIDDADADESLVVSVDLARAGDDRDRADAILATTTTASDL
jgi:hypothetical protein